MAAVLPWGVPDTLDTRLLVLPEWGIPDTVSLALVTEPWGVPDTVDTLDAPVVMVVAGSDQINIQPGTTVTLDSSASVGVTAGRTWSLDSGPDPAGTGLSSTTAPIVTYVAPPTIDGAEQIWRVTDNATGIFDQVKIGLLPAEVKMMLDGVMTPLFRRQEP